MLVKEGLYEYRQSFAAAVTMAVWVNHCHNLFRSPDFACKWPDRLYHEDRILDAWTRLHHLNPLAANAKWRIEHDEWTTND